MKHYNNNSGYSIVISLLMVGFLIVVTSWVFNLVLGELNDNRWRENYLKAFAWAEWALELGLLQIKEKGYGYNGSEAKVDKDIANPSSNLLSSTPGNFKAAVDPLISYNLASATDWYIGILPSLGYSIVPLFTIPDTTIPIWVSDITLSGTSIDIDGVIWNLLWTKWGISWNGSFNPGDSGTLKSVDFTVATNDISILDFLAVPDNNVSYLILFNPTGADINYALTSSQNFTRPISTIISSAQVWKYKQNLETTLDNTDFLNILKYSIYSS